MWLIRCEDCGDSIDDFSGANLICCLGCKQHDSEVVLKMQRYHAIVDTVIPVPLVETVETLNPLAGGDSVEISCASSSNRIQSGTLDTRTSRPQCHLE